MVQAILIWAAILGQQSSGGEPIPLGYLAVGGALGLTLFTITAFRRLQRWSITDLETALARQRSEVARLLADLTAERETADVLRERTVAAEDEARAVAAANATLALENSALQAEVRRLRWVAEGTEGLRRPLPSADDAEGSPPADA